MAIPYIPIWLETLMLARWFHFVFSGIMGLLVFFAIKYSFYAFLKFVDGRVLVPAQRTFILYTSMFCGYSATWLIHEFFEKFVDFYTTPLGPHL